MPFRFTNQEYADMHYVYGFCDGNSVAATREYRLRFPNRRQPQHNVFANVHHQFVTEGLRSTPRNPKDRIANDVIRNNHILREFDRDPRISQRRVSRTLRILLFYEY